MEPMGIVYRSMFLRIPSLSCHFRAPFSDLIARLVAVRLTPDSTAPPPFALVVLTIAFGV